MKTIVLLLSFLLSLNTFATIMNKSQVICEEYLSVSSCSDPVFTKAPHYNIYTYTSIAHLRKIVISRHWLVDTGGLLGKESIIDGTIAYSRSHSPTNLKGSISSNQLPPSEPTSAINPMGITTAKQLCEEQVVAARLLIDNPTPCTISKDGF